MKTNGLCSRRLHIGAMALIAVTGLFSHQRLLTAQDATTDAREKLIAMLKAARQEYVNVVALEDEKRVLTELYLAEQHRKTSAMGLESAKVLAEKKIITGLQLDAAAQTATSADKLLEAAQTKLRSLHESKAQLLNRFDRLERAVRDSKLN